jgi:dTDP-glucose 4,6-dehydratase
MRILEVLRKMNEMHGCPPIVYASSFNALYGYPSGTCYIEALPPVPSSQYGWSKAAAELLYTTYAKAFQIPVIISRVGSAFGPRMRSDELIAKLITRSLQAEPFTLKSPGATRLWTYAKDVMSFYDKLTSDLEEDNSKYSGKILHCAGNVGDVIIANEYLAQIISNLVHQYQFTKDGYSHKMQSFKLGEYEPGEMINGKPVSFTVDCSFTRELLNWKPKYTLEQGIKETIEWFDESNRR